MYGRNYIEKDKGLDIYRKKCLDIHQKKLQEIRSKSKKVEIKKVEEIMTRKHEEKHRNYEFIKQEKDLEVNRSNKKLLEKLVEISKGRHLGVEAFSPVNHTISVSHSESAFRPKSLNIVSRKRESQKIEEENFKFAKRLFESHGLISVKEMREDWKEHVKIKKHCRKLILKNNDKIKPGRQGLLPPLPQNSSTAKGTTRDIQNSLGEDMIRTHQVANSQNFDPSSQSMSELHQMPAHFNILQQQIQAREANHTVNHHPTSINNPSLIKSMQGSSGSQKNLNDSEQKPSHNMKGGQQRYSQDSGANNSQQQQQLKLSQISVPAEDIQTSVAPERSLGQHVQHEGPKTQSHIATVTAHVEGGIIQGTDEHDALQMVNIANEEDDHSNQGPSSVVVQQE